MSEFREAVAAFEAATRRTLATCADIPEVAWTAHPRAGFSAAEAVEHLALSNELFSRQLASLLARPAGDRPAAVLEDAEVPHLFDRVNDPPPAAEPTGTWTERAAALQRFEGSAKAFAALAERDPGDMRARGAAHPLFGPLDGVQWALFAAAHTERHRSEIIRLKSLLMVEAV